MRLTAFISRKPAYEGSGLQAILPVLAGAGVKINCILPKNVGATGLETINIIEAPELPTNHIKRNLFKTLHLPALLKKAGGTLILNDDAGLFNKIKKPVFSYSLYGIKGHRSLAVLGGNDSVQCYAAMHAAVAPLSYTDAAPIKDVLSAGNDYFLIHLSNNNISKAVDILKAYSIFKKWQRSSIKLLLMFDAGLSLNDIPNIGSYAHKADIYACTVQDMPMAVNGCFAVISLYNKPCELLLGMHAHRALKPFISVNSEINKFIHGNAFVPVAEGVQPLADAMMFVYKNEQDTKTLTARGFELTAPFTAEHSAAIILQTLQTQSH